MRIHRKTSYIFIMLLALVSRPGTAQQNSGLKEGDKIRVSFNQDTEVGSMVDPVSIIGIISELDQDFITVRMDNNIHIVARSKVNTLERWTPTGKTYATKGMTTGALIGFSGGAAVTSLIVLKGNDNVASRNFDVEQVIKVSFATGIVGAAIGYFLGRSKKQYVWKEIPLGGVTMRVIPAAGPCTPGFGIVLRF